MMAGPAREKKPMHSEEQYAVIQHIRELLNDSRKHAIAIAQRTEGIEVRQFLLDVAAERKAMAQELARDLLQHDPRTGRTGTVAGSIRRVLLTVRDLINNTSEVNMLVTCERQDADLLSEYAEVLDSADLNESSRATLARQCTAVEAQLQRTVRMRRALETVEH